RLYLLHGSKLESKCGIVVQVGFNRSAKARQWYSVHAGYIVGAICITIARSFIVEHKYASACTQERQCGCHSGKAPAYNSNIIYCHLFRCLKVGLEPVLISCL